MTNQEPNSKPQSSPKAAALRCALIGIPVFPCDANKSPLTAADKDADGRPIVGTGGFYKATTDARQIEEWWTRFPRAMIGYPTGAKSGIDVLDLDVDIEKGKNGPAEIPDWMERSSIIIRTPRGGLHLLFKSKGLIGSTTSEIANGVDTRGTGGYAILPPSSNERGSYEWVKGGLENIGQLEEFPRDLAARMIVRTVKEWDGNDESTADPALVAAALTVIQNEDLGWEEWNNVGLAAWAATNGEGFEAFDEWSSKSSKYNSSRTLQRWNHYGRSPPSRTGAGKLFAMAFSVSRTWDQDYYASITRPQSDPEIKKEQREFFEKELASKPKKSKKGKAKLEGKKKKPEAAPSDSSKGDGPFDAFNIKVKAGEISRCVDETQMAVLAKKRPVFVRGGALVEPIWSEYPTKNGGKTIITVFKSMMIENLRYMINKHKIIYLHWNEKGNKWVKIDPPDKVMATMLKLGHWHFPRVAGIINSPTMRPNGTILKERGYDAMTQLWCWPGELKLPEIKAKPSKKDAAAALRLLVDLLEGFAFKAPLDRSVALAAILSTVLRGAFDVAPMTLFVAHMAGTGKSYMVDLISTIVRGRPCPVITASRSEEEMEKRIGALLIESVPIVSLDNLSFDLKSDLLCQMCTQETVKVRVLGKSEAPDCEWKGTLFATGNNVTLAGDMTRRGLICNLDAGMEKPETREHKFSAIDRVMADRGAYIAAALTLARAYVVSGSRVKCSRIGSYEPWSKFVREPLIWAGEEDPVLSMEQAYRDDPVKDAAERLIEQWKMHLGTTEAFKINEIIEKARETRPAAVMGVGMADWEHVRPDFYDILAERAGERGQIDPRKMAYWLRSLNGQIYNGFKVMLVAGVAGKGHRWKVTSR